MIKYLPRESWTVRRLVGEACDWGWTEHLLATQIDLLAAANWQRAGRKSLQKPIPIRRPGQKQAGEKRYGGGRGMTVAELEERMAAWPTEDGGGSSL